MIEEVDKVRASNEGHAFHIVWTARICLRLLDPKEKLTAVTVENISPSDSVTSQGMREGILKVDTAEYYGGESFTESKKVVYQQLKYSPTRHTTEWKAGEVAEVITAFAKIYNELCNTYGDVKAAKKAQFQFVTNRPVAKALKEGLSAAHMGSATTGKTKRAFDSLRNAAKILSDKRFRSFAGLVSFQAGTSDRKTQSYELSTSIARYLPGKDTLAILNLEDKIRNKALLSGDKKPIKRLDVLQSLGIPSEEDLLPAPPSADFHLPSDFISRLQEQSIAQDIIDSNVPVIIHAPGGVGKSMLALRLPQLMPIASESVVFDGFADGLYRDPSSPRHRHDRALVQIANELAFRGLCDPLLPTNQADTGQYIAAFLHRLEQASAVVQRNSSKAVVLIILDAADNSQMGAEHETIHGKSFARDLLQVANIPKGCRIVALARTERVDTHLYPSPTTKKVKLNPFTLAETGTYLRKKYPHADDQSIKEFHRLTSENPRVQSNELSFGGTLTEVLLRLGKNPLTVDKIIGRQLEEAVVKIKQHTASPEQIDRLCIGLAALPPLVPIHILAKAAQIPEALVRSFIAEMGRSLMELDGAVHFRDEPVDTWFRQTFGKKEQYGNLIDAIRPLTEEPYVSSALPELMWQAGRIDDLMNLATGDEALPKDDQVERRRIVLKRIQYALKAAVQKQRHLDIAKLALRGGEEAASNNRQTKLFFDNADLLVVLFGAKRTQEIVFRHHAKKWLGSEFAHGAAMLVGDPQYHGEARNMLRSAENWLDYWATFPTEERQKQPIDNEDRAAMALAHLRLHGAKALVRYLSRWSPAEISFTCGSIIINRLIDTSEFDLIEEIAKASTKNPYLILAIAHELSKIGKVPKRASVEIAIKKLRPKLKEILDYKNGRSALISLAEAGARVLPKNNTYLLPFLKRCALPIKDWAYSSGTDENRSPFLRSVCLIAVLKKREIELRDVISKKLTESLDKNRDSRDIREAKETLGVVLPIYKVRAEIIANRSKIDVGTRIQSALDSTKGSWGWGDRKSPIANEFVRTWISTLSYSGQVTNANIKKLETWMEKEDTMFTLPTHTLLTRITARAPLLNAAERFANKVKSICENERTDADSIADSYVKLSRAVIPLGQGEAASYFKDALDVVSRFGQETFERWETIVALANKAGNPSAPDPELAYRFARAGEVVHTQLADSFGWSTAIVNIAKLCPSSAWAIMSRWLDRGEGWIGDILPACAKFMVEAGLLSPTIAASLHTFPDNHNLSTYIDTFLEKESDQAKRALIIEIFSHDILIRGDWGQAKSLQEVAKKYGISNPELEAASTFAKTIKQPKQDREEWRKSSKKKDPKVNWKKVLGKRAFLTSEDIDAAYRSIIPLRPYYPVKELYTRIRKRIPRGKETDYLYAVINSSELEYWGVFHEIQDAIAAWKTRASFQSSISNIITAFTKQNAIECLKSSGAFDYRFKELSSISGLSDADLTKVLLEGAVDSIEKMNAESF